MNMKKTIYLKSIFLLCLLLARTVSAQADGFDYDCVKVTDLSQLEGGETVLLVDESKNLALSPLNGPYGIGIKGINVAIGEDNVIRNLSADLIWTIESKSGNSFTFSNNGKSLWGSLSSSSVSVTNEPYGQNTNEFFLDEYGENGGKLYYVGNTNFEKSYFSWSTSDNTITIDSETQASFTLYKVTEKNYVKWKLVDGTNVTARKNDVVAIVDTNTGRAMSNDKGDKAPDAVAVTLNYDKDRLLGEVPENVQWSLSWGTHSWFGLAATDPATDEATDDNLYADSDGLKVGTNEPSLFMPTTIGGVKYMQVTVDQKDYLAGVEASMFSNTWILKELKDNKPDDKVKDTRFAMFKKIDDPQRIVTIELPEYYNYDFGKYNNNEYTSYDLSFDDNVTITGAEKSEIKWKSSNTDVIEINEFGYITQIKKRGTAVITAYVEEDTENYTHDKASAQCTVIVDDLLTGELGSKNLPLTVAEAKELAETGHVTHDGEVYLTWEEGVNYYIKGKVSKVNSGMMAMFGDMDFGEMMGDSGSGMNFEDSMDDMDFDPEDMEESGFDMSSMGFDMSSLGFDMSAMFGTSDKVTYYISDDGTKDGQMKVVNGCGTLKEGSTGAMEFNPIPKLSPGDCVVVCGPLVYTEDTNMFSSFMGGGDDEPEMSGKVDEMNYLAVYDPTLLVQDREIYVDKTLKVVDGGYTDYTLEKGLYSIDNLFDKYDGYNDEVKITDLSQIKEATFKSSDEEIAKWDEEKQEIIGVKEGKAKITVKVKVVLQEADDNADPKVKERSYTMKRKFKIVVKTRDLDPAGYYDGEWKLTTSTDDLEDGTRLVHTDYMMVENNAMMGGGKNGSKIEFDPADTDKETIESETVIKKKGLEVVLEKDENNADIWYLNVGEDENGTPLYLYASDSSEVEEEGEGDDEGGDNKFDFNKIMEMFNSSSGLKVGTRAEATSAEGVDSCMATITFNGDIATIKFINVVGKNKAGNTVDKSNTIMLSSSFDMEEMMNMFSSTGEGEGEEGQEESGSTFDMGSFDMFMAAFNTKKPGDEKSFMPRIYRFVPDPEFDVPIGDAGWKTIVTYKDVKVPENVKAYVATDVRRDDAQTKAILSPVEKLKGGEPYLLYTEAGNGNYTMTLLTEEESEELSAPEKNLLLVSDRKTAGEKGNTSVYVLANKDKGVGFYRWTGGQLGKGRVYLPVEASVAGADEFCSFSEVETTAIREIDSTDSKVRTYYDLQGRRVLKPTKGVYIVDGKKQVVK